MKEYEIHVSANYRTSGGTKEGTYFVEYRKAKTAAQAKAQLRAELREQGYYSIKMDAIEA